MDIRITNTESIPILDKTVHLYAEIMFEDIVLYMSDEDLQTVLLGSHASYMLELLHTPVDELATKCIEGISSPLYIAVLRELQKRKNT